MAEQPTDVVQGVMLATLLPSFRQWLEHNGLTLGRIPDGEEDLITYCVGVGDELAYGGRAPNRDPS